MLSNMPKEQIQLIVSEIQSFYLKERQENISEVEAQKVLEFMKDTIAPFLYNAILYDVFRIIENQCDHFEKEILKLEQPKSKQKVKFN
ncbi:uncharacterized protein SAMN05880501_10488 [Ureibacillus xyleni]|uniref:DUF2164 domain-containing protein n=1 Tax=Ureibacillus xyleni TaxID=614648 RepID=A0A285SDJ2_9BACL|nr:DUF2164 family protein [Ureibacillus xyleni]SOC05623.1 uncharacterized protein SAMN05880501_10488 [Ureibacillus xyleni]